MQTLRDIQRLRNAARKLRAGKWFSDWSIAWPIEKAAELYWKLYLVVGWLLSPWLNNSTCFQTFVRLRKIDCWLLLLLFLLAKSSGSLWIIALLGYGWFCAVSHSCGNAAWVSFCNCFICTVHLTATETFSGIFCGHLENWGVIWEVRWFSKQNANLISWANAVACLRARDLSVSSFGMAVWRSC